jgi:hypothetical protein
MSTVERRHEAAAGWRDRCRRVYLETIIQKRGNAIMASAGVRGVRPGGIGFLADRGGAVVEA